MAMFGLGRNLGGEKTKWKSALRTLMLILALAVIISTGCTDSDSDDSSGNTGNDGTATDTGDNGNSSGTDSGNESPAADNRTVTTDEDTAIEITLTGSDADGDALTYSIVSGPLSGTLSGTAPDLTYTPNTGFSGTDSFTFKVNDGTADSDSANVTIIVGQLTSRPNILIVIGDDMGIDTSTSLYPDIIEELESIYGVNSGVRGTPASMPVITDRLAQEGMVFQNVWAQQMCSPMRASALTGLFANNTNIGVAGGKIASHQYNMAQQLLENGYHTAAFGKWHLGEMGTGSEPCDVGFEIFKGDLGAFPNDYWNYTYQVQNIGDDAASNATTPRVSMDIDGDGNDDITDTTYWPVVKVADTMEWIEERETNDPDTPWFVWLAFNVPHTPLHIPEEACLDQTTLDELNACGGSCSNAVMLRAMINAMDTLTGTLLTKVESLDPNTIIIFVGDNGTLAGSIDNMYLTTNGRGKKTVWESGIRVPLAIKGPGIQAGGNSTEFVAVSDLFATVLELAGIDPPPTNFHYSDQSQVIDSDSLSLVPILAGGDNVFVRDMDYDYITSERFSGSQGGGRGGGGSSDQVAVRNGTYKLICTDASCSTSYLYDLSNDPLEENALTTNGIDCSNYDTDYSEGSEEWSYCSLKNIIMNETYFGR